MGWTLITVTGEGAVHHSPGFATKHLCEQAKCMALYGMTMEEFAEQKRLHEISETKRMEFASYPSSWDDKAKKGEAYKISDSEFHAYGCLFRRGRSCVSWSSGEHRSYNPNSGESYVSVNGRGIIRHRCDVKSAFCVPDEAPPPHAEDSMISRLMRWKASQ